MSTSEWAKKEIELACKYERGDKDPEEWDYGCACYESACKPNGEYISIEKFLKETDKGWTEISRNEYNSRFLKEIERRKKTYGFETL